ncbi:MAG TPA: mechanosensitive ion channel protein MscS [Flavobacteriaceae bacterium]|jgi:small-conductance mechanosensitive channel|nr:mechanosensitive ion channel protein MscS [Flavobacteriaceae bacterium]HBS11640.1 mechanosensitive ion channel protein MscS [Flavobacteriaceae bacterium]
MEKINAILNHSFAFGNEVHITVKVLLLVIIALFIASFMIKLLKKLITRKLPTEDKLKFTSLFSYLKWFFYIIIVLMTLHNMGVNVTAVFATSAALLIGIGLALQTFFQDIISGIFILVDQSVHVGDIIELDGKVGRVVEIKLRTTRAVTFDNKVLVIPNHLYLTNTLFNWTENGMNTRESVDVGVAYGSDTALVKRVLLDVAKANKDVYSHPEPTVFFTNFGDSSLDFKLVFTLNDSFQSAIPKSDIRFAIDKAFREHNITIPFPQRDVHVVKS